MQKVSLGRTPVNNHLFSYSHMYHGVAQGIVIDPRGLGRQGQEAQGGHAGEGVGLQAPRGAVSVQDIVKAGVSVQTERLEGLERQAVQQGYGLGQKKNTLCVILLTEASPKSQIG